MSASDALKTIPDGPFVVGEYRAGYAGIREWVDREKGEKQSSLSAHILIEMSTATGVQALKLYVNPPPGVTDPKQVSMPWKKGQRYMFPIRNLKSAGGALTGSLDDHREVIALQN